MKNDADYLYMRWEKKGEFLYYLGGQIFLFDQNNNGILEKPEDQKDFYFSPSVSKCFHIDLFWNNTGWKSDEFFDGVARCNTTLGIREVKIPLKGIWYEDMIVVAGDTIGFGMIGYEWDEYGFQWFHGYWPRNLDIFNATTYGNLVLAPSPQLKMIYELEAKLDKIKESLGIPAVGGLIVRPPGLLSILPYAIGFLIGLGGLALVTKIKHKKRS
ncbi:MAG: hypothetical protein QXK72_07160 [Candidatus Bathyarchaeia archaeon]